MSRTRIVGGTITKTTGGNHSIYSGGNIVQNAGKAIKESSDANITAKDPKDAPEIKKMESKNFDITFILDKNEKTIVPFGIKDSENKRENQFVKFKLKISGGGINHWQLDIKSQEGVIYTCYSATQELSEVVIIGKSKKTKATANTEKEKPQETSSPSLWPAGEYTILWDGFDNNDIYDSTRFNGKKLEAKITATKEGKQKNATVDFATEYNQVQWTDVKIDKKAKRINVTLRVNFYDGGAKGLKCNTYSTESEMSYETFTPTTNQPDPFKDVKTTICDWDKIPKNVLNSLKEPIIKSRTKTFEQLKDLAIEGLAQYWGRNAKRNKNVMLNGVAFEVFVNAVNLKDKEKTMDNIPLVYHTNGDWGRSGNPASPITNTFPDTGIIQQLSYNAGYIKRFDADSKGFTGWIYQTEIDKEYPYGSNEYDAISDFKETAAHEIGHEILHAYYGNNFSWQHKGSSYYFPQDTKPIDANKTTWEKGREYIPLAPYIPFIKPLDLMPNSKGEYYPRAPNEIDLMKYYNIKYTTNPTINALPDLTRTIATENDVLGLIWLTKLKIK